jgi:3-oxoacyl-[acyl-carrier protein] reductase
MPANPSPPAPASPEPRVVLLTGAASGIGAAAARRIARPDWKVLLVDRDPAVEDVARQVAGHWLDVQTLLLDLGDVAAIQAALPGIEQRYGRLDVLVNNAGIHPKDGGRRLPVEDVDLATWQQTLNVNLTAPFLLSQFAFRLMKARGWGRIVNIASRAGRTFIAEGSAHYSSTKAGLIGLTRLMAGEGGPHGITVNCVAPGRIVTPLSSQGIGTQLAEKYKSQVPAGRVGQSDELAAAIAYYLADDAGFTTGTVLDVNGGAFMG